jgi:CRISPR/Cas system CSM-associated protein Csm3 (group 7 of RAMP superfamily)
MWSANASRRITTRVVVEGDLVLHTPAHFGNGDTDQLTDMPLVVDPHDGRTPLLTGASIAGALRSYVRERECGYGQRAERTSSSVLLFGGLREDEEGEQSSLIVEDAFGTNFGIEMREGVGIDSASRTAAHQKLFDLQLWCAGTTFPLRFELLICEGDDPSTSMQALATALAGLNDGSITLGSRKRSGLGQVSVTGWRVRTYNLATPDGLLHWIEHVGAPLDDVTPVSDINTALGVAMPIDDQREYFHIGATFSLEGSLLIRSGSGQDDRSPDMVHLHTRQANGSKKPIVSGTSIKGAIRARALKIANTLDTQDRARALIEGMFGLEMKPGVQPEASRVSVAESVVQNGQTGLVQNRVSIDRFTSGARDNALYSEQPVFGGDDTAITLELRLAEPSEHEIGLLLLLLKDLWTGDLPLGGESSVGRGRLKGEKATLSYQSNGATRSWDIVTNGRGLTITGDRDVLEKFVADLNKHLKEAS